MRRGRGAETIGMREEGGGGETGFMGNFSKIMNVKVQAVELAFPCLTTDQ